MAIHQDPTHPTGVLDTSERGGSEAARARTRKAHAAAQLRREFVSWDDIAEQCGYPNARAAQVAVELALENELKTREGKEFMRQMANERYEKMLAGLWKTANDPESPDRWAALDRVRTLMKDHIELNGTAAPRQQVITTPTTRALEEWVGEVLKTKMPVLEEDNIFDIDVVEDRGAPLPVESTQVLPEDETDAPQA